MNRSEIIFLYDIADNNPNGDPLDSNKPRIDEETGENIVTDARLKRTIRDYLHDYKGEEIFVREIRDKDGKVQDAKKRASDFGKTKEEVSKNVLENCIDVRLFGGTIPLNKDSVTFTGPVQFNLGRSLHKVDLKRIKGTGAFASGEGKANKTFREEYILSYSLVGFYGIINENAAKITNLTQGDINLLIEGMWNGTKNLISRSKVGQLPRLNKNVDDEAIRSPKNYTVNINDLVKVLDKNKDKILNIEYKIDEEIALELDGKEIDIKDAIKNIDIKELEI